MISADVMIDEGINIMVNGQQRAFFSNATYSPWCCSILLK